VTRRWLPQRAGSPRLNSGGAAAAVPPIVVGVKRIIISNWLVTALDLLY